MVSVFWAQRGVLALAGCRYPMALKGGKGGCCCACMEVKHGTYVAKRDLTICENQALDFGIRGTA